MSLEQVPRDGENTGSHRLVAVEPPPPEVPIAPLVKPVAYLLSLVAAIVLATIAALGWIRSEVREQIDPVAANVRELRTDVREIKADVAAIRAQKTALR